MVLYESYAVISLGNKEWKLCSAAFSCIDLNQDFLSLFNKYTSKGVDFQKAQVGS